MWEKEYAAPWMLVLNALGVVGYQIVSMIFVAYQVLFRLGGKAAKPVGSSTLWVGKGGRTGRPGY